MKTTNLLRKMTRSCFICAFALTLPVAVARAERPAGSAPAAATGSENQESNKISGKVVKKTASAISVDGRMVALSPATSYIKAGASIALEDVNVGDQVKVVAVRTENGILQAVTVEVLT